MLKRAWVLLIALAIATTSTPIALADGPGVQCPPNDDTCVVIVTDPGAPGTGPTPGVGTPGGSERVCHWPGTGEPMNCHGPFGWWSDRDQCFYQRTEPQPPSSDLAWGGHFPDGAVYTATCPGAGGPGGGWLWFADPPDGYGGGGPTPEQVAARAVELLPITGPVIGMAPAPGSNGLVGLPVWMWTAATPAAWGPVSATASVPGISVTATAQARKVVWDMGDGHTVTCATPGTPYTPAMGDRMSPTCGHRYLQASTHHPGGAYTVTATTTWAVSWAGAGASGSLTVTRASSVRVRIGELQVLVT